MLRLNSSSIWRFSSTSLVRFDVSKRSGSSWSLRVYCQKNLSASTSSCCNFKMLCYLLTSRGKINKALRISDVLIVSKALNARATYSIAFTCFSSPTVILYFKSWSSSVSQGSSFPARASKACYYGVDSTCNYCNLCIRLCVHAYAAGRSFKLMVLSSSIIAFSKVKSKGLPYCYFKFSSVIYRIITASVDYASTRQSNTGILVILWLFR